MNPRPFVVNQSHMKVFLLCQRKYGWYRIQGLEPVGRRSAPEIGTAVHAGLAVLHAENGTLEAALQTAQAKLAERAGPSSAFEDKDLDEAAAIVQRLLPAYATFWGAREEMWAPIDAEIQFLVEVGTNTGIFLRGRADNLSTMMNGIYLVDYKTAAKMDPRDLLKYELDLQLTAYIYGISKQLTADSLATGGEPIVVQGAIIDVLVKTQVPQFARETYTRTEEELAEFEAEFIEYGQRIRAQLERVEAGENWKTVFPKNTEACFHFGTCAFRDLCLADTSIRRAAYDKREPDYVEVSQQELLAKWKKKEKEKE